MAEVFCIYPPRVFSYNWSSGDPRHGKVGREIEYSIYQDAMKNRSVGDVIRHHAAAPGVGHVDYRLIRLDETGVYGEEIENTIRELHSEEVR